MTQPLLPPIDYETIKKNFLTELHNAAKGQESSLHYFKHMLPERPLISQGIIQGIVIGGTNYIVSTQELFLDGKKKILSKETGELPILDDKAILISFLKRQQDKRAIAVGVNFGFGMEPITGPHGEIDGISTMTSKEHRFSEITGHAIGDFVREAFEKDIPVAVANDTVCLALAGDGNEDGSLIAGTGFNLGIKQEDQGKKVIINLEAGSFDKFAPSEVLSIIDAKSERPGKYLFEKVISGKYLALYFNEKSKNFDVPITPLTTSQELSELSHTNHTDIAGDLARAILERSAFLVGSALAAIYTFSARSEKLTIIGEGSMLWKAWQYHENVQKKLLELGVPKNAIVIKHIPESSINGAIGLVVK